MTAALAEFFWLIGAAYCGHRFWLTVPRPESRSTVEMRAVSSETQRRAARLPLAQRPPAGRGRAGHSHDKPINSSDAAHPRQGTARRHRTQGA